MPCTIMSENISREELKTGNYEYTDIDQESGLKKRMTCRPIYIAENHEKIKFSILTIGLLACVFDAAVGCSGGFGYSDTLAFIFYLMIIPTGVILCLTQHYMYKLIDKQLQNPECNPEGYKYQGRMLTKDDPHYQLHLAYYKRFQRCELSDNIKTIDDIEQIFTSANQYSSI